MTGGRWGSLLAAGAVLALASRLAAEAPAVLRVRVVDAETGRPLPARLSLRAADGSYPGDRLRLSAAQWPHLEAHAVFQEAERSYSLPPGETRVAAAHGLQYEARQATVRLESGKTADLEIRLRRVVDLRQAGWVGGDFHVHMLHGENQRPTSYRDVAETCRANGLDFVSVGQEYVRAGKLDLAGYQRECAKVSDERFTMLLGAERPKSLLGHMVMVGGTNPFLIPEDPPYHASARKVREQGGAVVYVHPVRYFPERQYQGQWLDFPGNNLARELVFDAFCGPAFDGLSVLSDEPHSPNGFGLWFALLNRGLFVPALADSDACFDRPTLGLKVPGIWTTYLYLGPQAKVTGPALAEAVRRGRTFATTGPLLQFSIDGEISGETLAPGDTPRAVKIDAWLPQHAFTLEKQSIGRVELIRNGVVVKTWEPGASEVHLTHSITERERAWYVARVFGDDHRWQVAVASPIYFAPEPVPQKQPAFQPLVRGRIYDFTTGAETTGKVEILRGGEVLKSFDAKGRFQVRMPLDAEIRVQSPGARPITRSLLLDYGPVHRFLWYLQSADLAKSETFERFEKLISTVDLEFPAGLRTPGSYFPEGAEGAPDWSTLRVVDGPPESREGSIAIAAVLMDAEQVQAGDTLSVAALFRSEGDLSGAGPLVVELRGYDPRRPTAYGELKKCAEFEKTWATAVDVGGGYRMVAGSLRIPDWVESGPTGGLDLSVRARQGSGDAAFVGLHVPYGPARRALSLSTPWPAMPLAWPDGRYGIDPFRFCGRAGRERQPRADYRKLRLRLKCGGRELDLLPARDGRGCADADDALYTGQFLDQVLSEVSGVGNPDPIRPQPVINWDGVPVRD